MFVAEQPIPVGHSEADADLSELECLPHGADAAALLQRSKRTHACPERERAGQKALSRLAPESLVDRGAASGSSARRRMIN